MVYLDGGHEATHFGGAACSLLQAFLNDLFIHLKFVDILLP